MTVDEARDIYRNRGRFDHSTVQRAMRILEQDANQHWGATATPTNDTQQALTRAFNWSLIQGLLADNTVDLIRQLIREEIEAALELERGRISGSGDWYGAIGVVPLRPEDPR
jgi:hypothetical protein